MVDECSLCGKSVELVVKSRHLISGNWIGLCTYCLTSLAEDRIRSARISGEKVGRLQGARIELERQIKELEDSLEFYECDYGKFEQQVVDKVIEELNEHINKTKKRLKELSRGE